MFALWQSSLKNKACPKGLHCTAYATCEHSIHIW